MEIGKYSWGIGDRFAHQAEAQLKAMILAKNAGIDIVPVWNKSNREHMFIRSEPTATRAAADAAVKALGWTGQYFCDADHINMNNVDRFMNACDFFTLDVADYIGKEAATEEIEAFIEANKKYIGNLSIPGIAKPFIITENNVRNIAKKFLFAIKEAATIYQYVVKAKGEGNFVPEVSMDEVNDAQSPVEMFFILSAIAQYKIPAQTIAPKFTGRFNKGVDYVGDIKQFATEFEEDLLVIDFAVKEFGLPENLKLSIHSGSDKFSIYPVMGELIKKHNKGIHVKTAGTTWLEEVIGLAEAGGDGLEVAKKIYADTYEHQSEMTAPYATVIDIDFTKIPAPEEVNSWDSQKFAESLRHVPSNPNYNPNFRQLIHVAFKIAANLGAVYTKALEKYAEIVGQQVTENLWERHIKLLFGIR
ncbi:MAG: tagaturonate epimerase family protein [Bacteroidales bacterium]|nr:tagaturonate epimerase family protein [Bacteroidales bacterium]